MAVDVAAWLADYGSAWERHDGAAAAALFAEEAVYWWGPFDTPLVGTAAIRERWDEVTAGHGRVGFSAEPLGTDGARAFARWEVTLRPPAGEEVRLDGIFVLDFAPDGRCERLQEWWMVRPPPARPGAA
jgi:ketosteroid isomerase-like protein